MIHTKTQKCCSACRPGKCTFLSKPHILCIWRCRALNFLCGCISILHTVFILLLNILLGFLVFCIILFWICVCRKNIICIRQCTIIFCKLFCCCLRIFDLLLHIFFVMIVCVAPNHCNYRNKTKYCANCSSLSFQKGRSFIFIHNHHLWL